jgi:hypothetical protein
MDCQPLKLAAFYPSVRAKPPRPHAPLPFEAVRLPRIDLIHTRNHLKSQSRNSGPGIAYG